MKILAFFVLGLTCIAAQNDECAPQSKEEESYRSVVSGLQAFSFHMYQEVRSGEQGNLVVSPLSAFIVLALVLLGANGRTAQQLGDVLHLPLSRNSVADGFRQLFETLPTSTNQSDDEALLRLANRLYVQSGFPIKDDYEQSAVKDFKSGVEQLNFADSENARQIINQWVADNTNDRILNLIPQGVLSGDTRLVLVNAILFSAQWAHQFRTSATINETFHLSESEQVDVSMMHGSFQLDYAELPDLNATALKLPYKSRDFESEMMIILPNCVTGLYYLEANLGELVIENIPFRTRQVSVHLPKFTITTTLNMLTDNLKKLGVIQLFENQADLHGISEYDLFVSAILQKAFIEVNENGTEAAAATVAGISVLSLPVDPVEFQVKYPFMFMLVIEKSIGFMGRVVDPTL